MKFVFFGNDTEKIAAIRYRIITFARMLEGEGHHCVVCLPASVDLRARLFENKSKVHKVLYLALVFLRRCAQLRHVPGADAVYFRGPVFPYGPPFFERLIAWLNPRLVFDIDDAIWEPPAHVDSFFVRFMDFGWVRKMARLCRHAVVGNRLLADYVEQYMRPEQVTIVPTCIDMARHTQKQYSEAGAKPVVLGWTGLKDNLGYLKPIEGVLRELAQEYEIRLLMATGADYALEGVAVENRRWRVEDEVAYLQEPDIGLMPLTDTPRARGKCAFKALQYMGVGTPCVISPVGMNAEVIEDGVNGFLAETPVEWKEKLVRLIANPELRRRMGEAARETVRERYSHEAFYPRLKEALLKVSGGAK